VPAALNRRLRDTVPKSRVLSTYVLAAPYARSPLRRRLSGLALAMAVNVGLLLILMTLGIIPPPSGQKTLRGIVVDLIPANRTATPTRSRKTEVQHPKSESQKPVPKPPPIVIPVKPTIATPKRSPNKSPPWIEMSKDEMASADISKLPAASGEAGDSEVVGRAPNGEALYAAEWARRPTHAELAYYLPHNGIEGFGVVVCKTIPNDRVDDCQDLDQTPGSHLASAVRQAAWQFRVRPPRKGGKALVGSWVSIRIDVYNVSGSSDDFGH
jgi:periplasmic protein TonB